MIDIGIKGGENEIQLQNSYNILTGAKVPECIYAGPTVHQPTLHTVSTNRLAWISCGVLNAPGQVRLVSHLIIFLFLSFLVFLTECGVSDREQDTDQTQNKQRVYPSRR